MRAFQINPAINLLMRMGFKIYDENDTHFCINFTGLEAMKSNILALNNKPYPAYKALKQEFIFEDTNSK